MPKLDKSKVLRIAGYAAFFLTCFVASAYLTFPYDRLRDVVVKRVEASAAPGEQPPKLEIEALGPNGLTGVSLTGVRYQRPAETEGEPPKTLNVDALDLSVSPLAYLSDAIGIGFSAEVGDGGFDGNYKTKEGEATTLSLDLDEVDLDRFGLGSYLGLPTKGVVSGTVDVTIAPKPSESTGTIQLHMEGLEIGDGKAKLKLPGMPGGLTLEKVDAGVLDLEVAIRDGVATIEKLEGKGKDLVLSGSGSIRLSEPIGSSRTDVTLSVKVEKGYINRSDRTKAAFELMGNEPMLKRATSADGTMRFRVTGAVTALHALPSSAQSRGSARGRRKGSSSAEEEPSE